MKRVYLPPPPPPSLNMGLLSLNCTIKQSIRYSIADNIYTNGKFRDTVLNRVNIMNNGLFTPEIRKSISKN